MLMSARVERWRNLGTTESGWYDRMVSGYADPPKLLKSYAGLIAAFNTLFAGFLWLIRRRNQRLPERIVTRDLVLLGVATHKVSRLITKDKVTSAVRAPFTEFEGQTGIASEVAEKPRGRGFRYAMGELIT
jgi:hypothetical protein